MISDGLGLGLGSALGPKFLQQGSSNPPQITIRIYRAIHIPRQNPHNFDVVRNVSASGHRYMSALNHNN